MPDDLPANWTRHSAPSGHFYYFNSMTKESTYERPKLPEPTKKKLTNEKVLPTFKVDLEGTDWKLVITNKGSHFFHNIATKESHWVVEDEVLANSMSMIDRDTLILLVAKSRGLKLPDICDSKVRELLRPKRTIEIKDIEPPTVLELIEDESWEDEDQHFKTSSGLLGGYSSTDSSDYEVGEVESSQGNDTENPIIRVESGHRESHEAIPEQEERDPEIDGASIHNQHDSGEEDGLNLAELDSSDGEEFSPENAKESFLQLLDDFQLDPFKPWEVESLKIIKDPRFYLVDDNKTRKRLYDEWAVGRLQNRVQPNAAPKEDPFVDFMRYLESKMLEGLFSDFKKKWDDELGAFDLSDREKEKTYKEFVIFMKKPQPDREKIFRTFVGNAKVFKKNLLGSKSRNFLESLDLDGLERLNVDQAYSLLHSLESRVNVSKSLKLNTKYFLVDVKSRIRILRSMSLAILE